MALRVFVADDDAGMRFVLKKIIEAVGGCEFVGEAADGAEAVRRCAELCPDAVFLDVEMPSLSGVEAARLIVQELPKAAIVFVTAHSEYMPEAFEVYAFDYLVKPFKTDRVRQTLQRLSERKPGETKEPGSPALMIRAREGITLIPVRDILMICREGKNSVVVTSEAEYPTSQGLNELWLKVRDSGFFRSHRAYIIRPSAVVKLYPYGRWTFIAKFKNTDRDALITREKLDELRGHKDFAI